jgi:hypothetical protein
MPIVGLLVWLVMAPAFAAASVTNTSANFSIGLGYTISLTWNDSETSAANTPTTIGNFTFQPSVTSGKDSNTGPTFTNRVYAAGNQDYSAVAGLGTTLFTNTVTASWNGGVPADADATNPNFRLALNITSVRLYMLLYDGSGNNFGFSETTPGHETNSPSFTLGFHSADPSGNTRPYTDIAWTPPSYVVPGTNFTRTFMLYSPNLNDLQLDGYEVFGNVQLIYDVPEPSAVALLAVSGALTMVLWGRRK